MILKRGDLLLRSEDLRLKVLQFLGDEAFRIGKRLLADVVGGYLVAPAMAHLDVVAEDLVVADLERLDARAHALALLHLLQQGFAVVGKGVQFVERRIIARANDAAIPHGESRLVHNRTFECVAEVVEGLNGCVRTREETARRRTEDFADGGECRKGNAQSNEVACVRRLRLDAREQTLKVIDRAQVLTQTAAQRCVLHEFRNSTEPRVNPMRCEKRVLEPRFQKACPHRRARKIEHVEKCVLLAAVAQAARDLKVAQRVDVELHRIRCVEEGKAVQLREIRHYRIVEVAQEGRDRRPCARIRRNLGSGKMLCEELVAFYRRYSRDSAVRKTLCEKRTHRVREGEAVRHQELCRHSAVELVENLLRHRLTCIGGVECLTCRDICSCKDKSPITYLMKQCDIDIRCVAQHLVRECRAGGHDLHHLAVRQPFCLRVADLLGDCDLEPLCDEACDVAVRRMIGHTAHGTFVEIAAAARERQSELLCRHLCIVKEHLIEVAETKEEQFVRMCLLRGEILLHHRRDVLRVHNEPPKLSDY